MEFQLFAPNNEAVAIVGSFSDWQEIPMTKGEDGYFRAQVDLEDGIYRYKFRVKSQSPALLGQWVEVNDPYVTELDRRDETGIIHVQQNQPIRDNYTWKYDDVALPANHELVIYEMHIADFVGSEPGQPDKFQRAIAKLDYLVELGINAIELMPITEYAGDYRWGYLVRYYFAPESSYGTPEAVKQLIDACHARGIRVIMDGIFNHTDDQSPLLLIDRDYWYYHDRHYPDDPANYWGPEFNYKIYDEQRDLRPAWSFVGDVVRYWITEYHIDGIRYDAVRQLADYEFCGWLIEQANAAAGEKPFYHIAEHIPDSPDITKPKGVFDACWHESFRFFLKDALLGEPIDLAKLKEAIDARQQGYEGTTSTINYLATHDRQHMIVELVDEGMVDQLAFQRVKLGVVLQMTTPGIPLIWMGDEFGQDTPKTKTTLEPNPLKWQLLEEPLNQDLFQFYKQAIALRRSHPALLTDQIEFLHEDAENRVLVYLRWHDEGDRVLVIANLGEQALPHYEVPTVPESDRWLDWADASEVIPTAGKLKLNLPEFTAKVLLNP
jgi:1,4-alpha-glucan branching enzyme